MERLIGLKYKEKPKQKIGAEIISLMVSCKIITIMVSCKHIVC